MGLGFRDYRTQSLNPNFPSFLSLPKLNSSKISSLTSAGVTAAMLDTSTSPVVPLRRLSSLYGSGFGVFRVRGLGVQGLMD